MKYRNLIVAIACIVFVGCTSIPPINGIKNDESEITIQQRNFLIGTWETDSTVIGGGLQTSTISQKADGTFVIDFLSTNVNGAPTKQTETGRWGVSGGIYFTITTGFMHDGEFSAADQEDPIFYDAYKIDKLDKTTFKYTHISTTDRFFSKKKAQ